SGKTTVGKHLAKKLGYTFIDSGVLYHYFAMVYSFLFDDLIYLQLKSKKKTIINNSVFYLEEFNLVYNLNSVLYLENRQRARFVVVGCDVTTNILSNADIKIVLIANLITRINRRCDETKSTATEITRDIISRNEKSYKFIKNAIK
ncbi:15836_t:CDS:2, partial [Dentiscutata erythropus]